MPSVNLTGTLLNPEGEPDEGAIVKFTLLTTTGSTISSSKSQLEVPQDGLYDVDIQYGNLRVDYVNEDGSTRFVAIVTVNADTVATSLPELLNASVPPTNAQLLEFQTILAGAVAAEAGAVAAEAATVALAATFGTAATANVTTSATDTTAGRVLRAQDAYAVNSINYHTGNTNFNVFGGVSTGLIFKNEPYTTTEMRFYIPNYISKFAVGITNTGTFSLSYFGVVAASGILASSIEFLGSNRNWIILRITGLSGLTVGREYSLFSETASSSITVNF